MTATTTEAMPERLHYTKTSAGAYHAMLGLEKYVHECGLEAPLIHLIKMRASQINKCAYCLDMHSKDLRAIGETEQRLYTLEAWRSARGSPTVSAPRWPGRKR
jgi:AhpD family alkylhydroperoxidase